jgi:uncharacterized membrane protein
MEPLIRFFAVLVAALAVALPAHAYIDPVTGSLVVQGLIALVAAMLAGVKSIRNRVMSTLSAMLGRKRK